MFPCMCRCRCKSLKLFRLPCPVLIHAVSSGKTITTLVSLSATNVPICNGWGQVTTSLRQCFLKSSCPKSLQKGILTELSQRKRYGFRRRDVEVIGRNFVSLIRSGRIQWTLMVLAIFRIQRLRRHLVTSVKGFIA